MRPSSPTGKKYPPIIRNTSCFYCRLPRYFTFKANKQALPIQELWISGNTDAWRVAAGHTDMGGRRCNHIIINPTLGRLKHKNISRDPRVAVSVIDQTNPYDMVTVRGRVVEQTTNGAEEHIDKMAKKYLGVEVSQAASAEKRELY